MENYEELVVKNQSGMIDDLDFLLEQEELAEIYIAEMQEQGLTPSASNASIWLRNYELTHLYK